MGESMRLRGRTKLGLVAVLTLAVCALTASAGTATGASASASLVPLAGTGSPQTGEFTPSSGDVTDEEFAGEGEDADTGPDPYNGPISLSTGTGHGNSVPRFPLHAAPPHSATLGAHASLPGDRQRPRGQGGT